MTAPVVTQAAPRLTAQHVTALEQFRYTRAQAARRVAGAFNTHLAGFAEPSVGMMTRGLGAGPDPVPSADPATGIPTDPGMGPGASAPIVAGGATPSTPAIDSITTGMIALSLSQSALWGAGLGWVSSGDGRGALIGATSSVGVSGLGLALVGLIVGRNGLALGAGGLAAVSLLTAGYLAFTRKRKG